MSQLTIYKDNNAGVPVWEGRDPIAVAEKFRSIGVRFEQWQAGVPLAADADDEAVTAAYAADIERLKREGGYGTIDVLRVLPDHPARTELRAKFLNEHIHTEDEVRFFVEGSGMFYLHAADHVYMVLCERGDLIGVPEGLRHWFDLGETPFFTAIRFFINPDGWVAHFTGDPIAEHYPKFEKTAA